MEDKQIYDLFKNKGAILEGHFLLSSGLHSPVYLQCAKILQYPDIAEQLCKQLAGNFNEKIDVVLSPAVGGIIVGQEVARILKAKAVFAERVESPPLLSAKVVVAGNQRRAGPPLEQRRAGPPLEQRRAGKMVLKRGFELKAGENVLAVEDVITTGGSLEEIIQLAKDKGCSVVGAGALVDRSGGKVKFGVKTATLLTLEIKNYPKESCPLCKQKVPLTYLGSRPAKKTRAGRPATGTTAGKHKNTR